MIPNALFNTEDIVTGTVTIPVRAWNGCGEALGGKNEYAKLGGLGECSGAIGEGMMLVIGPAEASGKTGPTLPSGKAIVGRLVAGGDSLFVRIFGEVSPELVPAGGPVPGRWFAAEVTPERVPTRFEARARGNGSKPPTATKAVSETAEASASNAKRAPWKITKEGTARVIEHPQFGKIFKSKSDGLWWSKDRARHGSGGRPQWKVFEETADGLDWKADADEFGDFIENKHKGPIGLHIPWSDVAGR